MVSPSGPHALTMLSPNPVPDSPDSDSNTPSQFSPGLSDAELHHVRAEAFLARRSRTEQNFTVRAVVVGLGIGTIVCLSNTYFGLQTGWVSTMSMPSALLGFVVFRAIDWARPLGLPFTPVENVLVQTVAGAAGTLPLGCGFVGVIPAMEYLLSDAEGGKIKLSTASLLFWALGVCFFGVVFAVPLRRQVIIREKLKFPSGTAAAHMISLLHNDQETIENEPIGAAEIQVWSAGEEAAVLRQRRPIDDSQIFHAESHIDRRANSSTPLLGRRADDRTADEERQSSGSDKHDWKQKVQLLIVSFGISACFTLLSYFVPVLHSLPVFGRYLAAEWLWALNPSPAYIGQGIIMGPETTMHMLLGAVFGWAVLSPLAKSQGWAPGPVSDWSTGSKGWIVWVSMAIMLTDSIINLGWLLVRQTAGLVDLATWVLVWIQRKIVSYITHRLWGTESQWSVRQAYDGSSGMRSSTGAKVEISEPDGPESTRVSIQSTTIWLVGSLIVCIAAVHVCFPGTVPFTISVLSLAIALVLSIMGVRAMGETDLNPVSGISKISQLFISAFTSSSPHAVLINLIAGALSEAGALQAGELMQDLKTGHIVGASSKAQFYGQLIGSAVGAVTATFVYRMYTRVYTIPGDLFEIPTAYVWVFTARFVTGDGLPPHATSFCLLFALIFAAATVSRMYATQAPSSLLGRWRHWIPGGIAFAVGMYNVPSFTLARAVGGLIELYFRTEPKDGLAKSKRTSYFPLWMGTRDSPSPVESSIRYSDDDIGDEEPSPVRTADQDRNLTPNSSNTNDAGRATLVVASGLILGEGVVSVLNLVLASMEVPHL